MLSLVYSLGLFAEFFLQSRQGLKSFFHHYTTGIKLNSGVSEALTKALIFEVYLKEVSY